MPTELTYPGLRCILEFLEPNKRLHIAARSPVLCKIDKSIPIHMHELSLRCNKFTINKTNYWLEARSEILKSDDTRYKRPENDLLPGDIFVKFADCDWKHGYIDIHFQNMKSWSSLRHRAPDGLEMKFVAKKVADLLLGYKTIYVDDLHFQVNGALRLPEGFKVHPRKLYVDGSDFKPFLPIIDVSGTPLREIALPVAETTDWEHPLVKTAGKLLIHSHDDPNIVQLLRKLSHKNVQTRAHLDEGQVKEIVGLWREVKKDIGTTFTFEFLDDDYYPYEYFALEVLYELPEEMKGCLKEVQALLKETYQTRLCASIQMNSTSEINIYQMATDKIRMEVMPLGTANPRQEPVPAPESAPADATSVKKSGEQAEVPRIKTIVGIICVVVACFVLAVMLVIVVAAFCNFIFSQ